MPTPEQLPLPIEGESQTDIFNDKGIRKMFHKGEWWFAVTDVVEALIDVSDGGAYIRKLRERDEGLKAGWDQIVTPLPFATAGGTQQVNFVNIEGIFRLMQSVPSPKADPFKKWLAKVGFERLQELHDPGLAIKRAMAIYHAKGYPDSWIEARIQNKVSREKLETEWKQRGVQGAEYAYLTDAISVETFGIKTAKHKELKGLKSQPLRDNMTPLELTLTTLGEQATAEIAKVRDAKGYFENLQAAKSGGQIAGNTREQLEVATGKRVVSEKNYLTERQRQNNEEALPPGFKETVAGIVRTPRLPKKKDEGDKK